MKSVVAIAVLSFVSFLAAAQAGEPASVLQQPTPATITETPAIETAASACAEGQCCTESSCRSSCRNGLFGRTIERTRTVTRAVVEVPVRVVAAPVRVFRAGRCNRCCCR